MWNVEIWHVMLFGNRTIMLWVFSTNTKYIFLINAYKEINQSVDSKQDGKSMG
jgi:hypothetical protein